jgi:hypothetical protein
MMPLLLNRLSGFTYQRYGATWRSGYATVCKTVYPGSIPGVASIFAESAAPHALRLCKQALPCYRRSAFCPAPR